MAMKNPAVIPSFNGVYVSVLLADIGCKLQITGLNMVGDLFPWTPSV
jgi:hypothetical protein